MNGFDAARRIETRAVEILLPFIEERAYDGRFVLTSKGRLARWLQETTGDLLFNSDPETVYSVEIKAEQEKRKNFFLETYSNRNLERMEDNARHGISMGWMFKLRADLMFYYYIDTDDLYIINFFRLQQWAFRDGYIYKYDEKRQNKYKQQNDTWGRCVPIADIPREIYKHVNPRQIPLFPDLEPTIKEVRAPLNL